MWDKRLVTSPKMRVEHREQAKELEDIQTVLYRL